MLQPFFAGLPGGIEIAFVLLLFVLLPLYLFYRIALWLKSVIEHGVGMKDGEE